MSYVFQGIQGMLGKDEDEQSQTDIFAAEGQQPGGAQAGEATPGQTQQPKTSTEGELGGAGGGVGTQQSSEGKPQQTQTADSRLMQRNKVQAAPGFATKAQGELAGAETNLQNEANAYVDQAKTKDYSVDDATLESAIGGDETAGGSVRGLLGGTADMAESFAPTTDYDIEDIYRMQTNAGVDGILRRESGPEYNSGEAAFDRSLLNRSGEFNQLRSLLKGKQEGLVKQADAWGGAEGEKSKAAQAAYDANFKTAQDKATGYLGSQSEALSAAQDAEVKAENEARAKLRTGTNNGKYVSEQAKKAINRLLASGKGVHPDRILQLIQGGGLLDAAKYYNISGDVGRDAAIDETEASRFNSIMGLLGKTDNWSAGGGFGDRLNFDSDGYSSALEAAAIKEYEKEQKAAAKLAAEQGSAFFDSDGYGGGGGGADSSFFKPLDYSNGPLPDRDNEYEDVPGTFNPDSLDEVNAAPGRVTEGVTQGAGKADKATGSTVAEEKKKHKKTAKNLGL